MRESADREGRTMSAELEGMVQDFFKAVDRLDVPAVVGFVSEDAQMVEEITRNWIRGKSNVEVAFANVAALVSNVNTEVSEFHTVVTGDSAIVTCIVNQTYTFEGNEVTIFAPTTAGFSKSEGDWKISLIHSVPLA